MGDTPKPLAGDDSPAPLEYANLVEDYSNGIQHLANLNVCVRILPYTSISWKDTYESICAPQLYKWWGFFPLPPQREGQGEGKRAASISSIFNSLLDRCIIAV